MSGIRYYLAVSAITLLATGCLRKEKIGSCPGQCTVVSGRLLTSNQQALANAPVSVSWVLRGGVLGGGDVRTRGRATTDASGDFRFSFYVQDDELRDGYFMVNYEVTKSQYYVLDDGDALFNIKRDTTYQLPPYLIPRKAAVKLTVPNANQIQGYFAVDFASAYGQTLTAKKGVGGGPVFIVPQQNNSYTNTAEVAGDQKLYMQITRNVSGTPTRTLDSLVVAAGTTRDIVVRY
jgi:hypothetical protein